MNAPDPVSVARLLRAKEGEGAYHTAMARAQRMASQLDDDQHQFWRSVAAEVLKLQPASVTDTSREEA